MHRRKFQLIYADQGGTHHYYRPTSRASCLRLAAKLLVKMTVAQVLIRQDYSHVKSNLPKP